MRVAFATFALAGISMTSTPSRATARSAAARGSGQTRPATLLSGDEWTLPAPLSWIAHDVWDGTAAREERQQ